MRARDLMITVGLAVGLALPGGWAWADEAKGPQPGAGASDQEKAATADSPGGQPSQVAAMPLFNLPNRGSPLSRLGGATRGAGRDGLPRIEALVPEEPGWTLQEQPVLYWYLSELSDVRIEFVVMRVEPMETLLETTLPRPERAGVQRIRLADHGVGIEPGITYQWLVKLVPDPSDRSYDRIVGGGLERVAPSPELDAQLADPSASKPHVLAAAGIWYDAVDELSRQIDAAPGNRTLWNQRAALFEQVGLPEVALDEGAAAGFERR